MELALDFNRDNIKAVVGIENVGYSKVQNA